MEHWLPWPGWRFGPGPPVTCARKKRWRCPAPTGIPGIPFTSEISLRGGRRGHRALRVGSGAFCRLLRNLLPAHHRPRKRRLRKLFPGEYEEYGRQVPLFLPSPLKRLRAAPVRFNWGLYAQNKEYRAVTGAAAFWLLLAAKALLLNR